MKAQRFFRPRIGVTSEVVSMSQDSSNDSEIQRFEAQYRLNPDSLVFARLADAYRKAGDPKRALEVLEAGIGRHRNYPSAHIVRARACIDLGQSGPAEEAFLRVLELDSGNLVALRGLAALARERGDLAGARQWFQRISELHQESADTVDGESENAPAPPDGSPRTERPTSLDPLSRTEEESWTPDSEAAPSPVGPAASGSVETWWFEDPDEGEPADDGDLLTRTMAELYEKQGLVEQAAAIYQELLNDRPDDEELQVALTRLKTRLAAIVPEDPVSKEPTARSNEPPVEAVIVAEPVAVEPKPHASGQSEVFLAWLRKLSE
jgi:tetratricopeptide (TPR) repeat protein